MNIPLTAISTILAQAPSMKSDAKIDLKSIIDPERTSMIPLWMMVSGGIIAVLIWALIMWLIARAMIRRHRALAGIPKPRREALAKLRAAEKQIDKIDPHAFSIVVSDILREYVSAQFHLHAPRQTSQEFLNSIANNERFSAGERSLLAQFLEKCDLIKFANIAASRDDSAALLKDAFRFVEGSAS